MKFISVTGVYLRSQIGPSGLILSFAYLEGKTLKSHEYSSSYANISNNTKEIGVLCQLYDVTLEKDLIPEQMDVRVGQIK